MSLGRPDDSEAPVAAHLPCYSPSTASRKASVPFAGTLLSGVEARMLLVSRQSQSRLVVLRLLQQGRVPGQCIGHSTSVKVVESHRSQHLENHRQHPNFHGIKRNTIFPTQMSRKTPQDGLYYLGGYRSVACMIKHGGAFVSNSWLWSKPCTSLSSRARSFMDVIQAVRCVDGRSPSHLA